MSILNEKDTEILRGLARRQLEFARSDENEEILAQWKALEEGRRERPTVRLLFSNFTHEVIKPRMSCSDTDARTLEYMLLSTMTGRELFGDDTPIPAEFYVPYHASVSPFGTKPKFSRPNIDNPQGYHIDPVIEDLEEQIDMLRGGSFGVDLERTSALIDMANEVFGDILPAKLVMGCLTGAMTHSLVCLMGMENFYISMYDCPDKLHEAMDMACSVYEKYYDFLEEKGLLLPTAGMSPIMQESFAFNNELPTDGVTKTTQCWGFLESQETTAVSAEMFGEFVFPYQDRLVKRMGLLSYGCCERVDAIWEGYLSKWKNLRKLSVSPFNNEAQIGEYLRGTNIVFYSKPRAEYVTNRGPLDEEAITKYFKTVAENASGCLFEVAQREVGTIYGDYERGRRYVQLAKDAIERYWKP